MKALVLFIAVALIAAQASGQQAGRKDAAPNDAVLSQLAAVDEAEQEACGGPFISQSCGSTTHEPERLSITLEGLSQATLHKGDHIVAAIRIQNDGEKPVALPWSTELPSGLLVSGGSRRAYYSAEITLGLKNAEHKEHALTLQGGVHLFSSERGAASDLVLKPGEWATLRISAVVDCKYNREKCEPFTTDADQTVIAEWHEYLLSRNRDGCKFSEGALSHRFLESSAMAVQFGRAETD